MSGFVLSTRGRPRGVRTPVIRRNKERTEESNINLKPGLETQAYITAILESEAGGSYVQSLSGLQAEFKPSLASSVAFHLKNKRKGRNWGDESVGKGPAAQVEDLSSDPTTHVKISHGSRGNRKGGSHGQPV